MRSVTSLLLALCLAACVERKLWIRTDPPGARVSVNGARVGRSPVAWRFDHYGKVLVEAELEGHEPVRKIVKLKTPWYQQPVADFFADVVVPARIKDDHLVTLKLEPLREMTPEEVERAVEEVTAAAGKARAEADSSLPGSKKE